MPILEDALTGLTGDALVIEHGAGLYSSTVVQRCDARVVCIEQDKMWRDWASWLYGDAGELMDRAKQALPILSSAALVFIDGKASERGDLLRWSLAARVPCIIAHDTEDDHRKQYGYTRESFDAPGYSITHDGVRPRTTAWRLNI